MNSIEAMMLTEDAAIEYMQRLDEYFPRYFPDRLDVSLMIKANYESAAEGEMSINEALAETIELLDELDEDDEFGTQGWRYSAMGEI